MMWPTLSVGPSSAAANSVWGAACACVLPGGPGITPETMEGMVDTCAESFMIPGVEVV